MLLFLHGFPEAAFVWDEMLEHFGDRYRCVAPNLRGYERSSAPAEVEAYRAKHLVADIVALIDAAAAAALEALIAHDWGGAVAWNLRGAAPGAAASGSSSSTRRTRRPSCASCSTTRRSRPPAPT